jgi:hypothetical protein
MPVCSRGVAQDVGVLLYKVRLGKRLEEGWRYPIPSLIGMSTEPVEDWGVMLEDILLGV